VVTKIAPFGAFARIEDGIEGLIHLSELTPGVDPKTVLHEGAQLQLRILRIDAERRRLGLSLRQVEEPEPPSAAAEAPVETGATSAAGTPKPAAESVPATPSLEGLPSAEHAHTRRHEGRGERRDRPAERAPENPLLSGLPAGNEGEMTAMAEAFRAAARQRAKEEAESSE